MRADTTGIRTLTIGFCALFFAFLFGPLIIMVITAFNSSSFPRITPWECFTTDWFGVLARDNRLIAGLVNTLLIGVGVVALSVPIGVAGALALTEVGPKFKATLYAVFITPILVPGVVIGISTLVFWNRVSDSMGLGYGSFLNNGMFLTIAGQVSFISAYTMLVVLARLQRFDPTLTEAALDLGATPGQAFRRILLPFLGPALGSAAVMAFLASAENYNTTTFTIGSSATFTTVLAAKVRYGIDPSISAVAVIIIAVTLIAALTSEVHARRSEAIAAGGHRARAVMDNPVVRVMGHPAFVGVMLVGLAGAAVWAGSQHDSSVCRDGIIQEKRALQQKLMEEQQKRLREMAPPATPVPDSGKAPSPFGGVFAPGNLGGSAPAPAPAAPAAPKPATPFGGVFAPGNLGSSSPAPAATAPAEPPPAAARPATPFGGVFAPDALKPAPAPAGN
ncbi:ABC transporter permease [Segnochrobactraceae bacterium EtOH-i3]